MEAFRVETEAARLNRMVMAKLQRALAVDPEVDLISKIPSTYAKRLADRRTAPECGNDVSKKVKLEERVHLFPEEDVRRQLTDTAPITVQFPVSESVQSLLEPKTPTSTSAENLFDLIRRSEVIWKPQFGNHKIVLKCNEHVALKIMVRMADTTEYTTLQYLETHLPNIPAPRPHGLIKFGPCYLLFMTLIQGSTLEAAWPKLDYILKASVRTQLDNIFRELRSFSPPEPTKFGGVAGEGCKDLRRHVRSTKEPIRTVEEFDDWQFSNPHFGSPVYIEVLRRLSPPLPKRLVLSHNDLRPDNIMVELKDGKCDVTGIIDWQYSGYYPEYYESTKVMNSISTNERHDWYLLVPDCIAPAHHAQKWLLDALWWKNVE